MNKIFPSELMEKFPQPPLESAKRGGKVFYSPGAQTTLSRKVFVTDLDICRELIFADAVFSETVVYPYHYSREGIPSLSIEVVLNGRLMAHQHGRILQIEAGDIFLMHPNLGGEIFVTPGEVCEKKSLSVFGPLLDVILEKSGLADLDCISGVKIEKIKNIFAQFEAFSNRDSTSYHKNALLCYELIQLLQFRNLEIATLVPEELKRLQIKLNDTCDKDHTLQSMADFCGWSVSKFRKVFFETYRVSPYKMLLRIRMHRAAWLLQNKPEMSVKEIAYSTGYHNPLNFSTAFHAFYNLSPRNYRKLKQ